MIGFRESFSPNLRLIYCIIFAGQVKIENPYFTCRTRQDKHWLIPGSDMTKTFRHARLRACRSIIYFLIPICMMGCLPVPYYHSWKGHIVTPSGKPLKNATVVLRNYHSCASVGGAAPQLLETKSKRTNADGDFSIFTMGINIDYFIIVAGCFGTEVKQYVCYQGKWAFAEDLQTNNDGVLQFDPSTARSGDLYWFDELSRNLKIDCGQ